MLETAGWEKATNEAKQALMVALERLASGSIEVVDKTSDAGVAKVDEAITSAMPLSMSINAWEGHWPLNTYARDMDRAKLSESAQNRLAQAEKMTQEEYQGLLIERQRIRSIYANLADGFDLCVSLTAPGAAPKGLGWTGDPSFVVPGSLLGVPGISLPVLTAEDRMPLGLQLLGFINQDAKLFAAGAAILALIKVQ